MESQKKLLRELDTAEGESWFIFLDAARADHFQNVYPEYLDGEYQTVYNGENPNTPQWFSDHFSYLVDGHLFHGASPISSIGDYDEEQYFDVVPSPTLYKSYSPEGANWATTHPEGVVEVVKNHLPEGSQMGGELADLTYKPGNVKPKFNMNVVRFLQPHVPYRSITEFTYPGNLENAIEDPDTDWTWGDVQRAYVDNLEWAMGYAAELVDTLRDHGAENIVVSSDHGECLGECGYFRHPEESDHDHLFHVPWLRVE